MFQKEKEKAKGSSAKHMYLDMDFLKVFLLYTRLNK